MNLDKLLNKCESKIEKCLMSSLYPSNGDYAALG